MNPWRREKPAGEAGQVTAFVTIFALALILVVGLVLDGGFLLAAKRQADGTAASAARAGAQMISEDELRRSGDYRIDEAEARRAVMSFLADAGRSGRVVLVDQDRVTVEVEINQRMLILGLGGLSARDVTGRATARIVSGVTRIES